MRRQRLQRLLAGGVAGELRLEAGRGEIKTVLVEERLARWVDLYPGISSYYRDNL
jgi:hypothetical protein